MDKRGLRRTKSRNDLQRVPSPAYYKEPPNPIPQSRNGYQTPGNKNRDVGYHNRNDDGYGKYKVSKPMYLMGDYDYTDTRGPTPVSFYSSTRRNSLAEDGHRKRRNSWVRGEYPQRSSSHSRIKSKFSYEPWKARVVKFYKNGDLHLKPFEFRFKPTRDATDLDALCRHLTKRIPSLPKGVRYIFTLDGTMITDVEGVRDGGSYVCSSDADFKVRINHLNHDLWHEFLLFRFRFESAEALSMSSLSYNHPLG